MRERPWLEAVMKKIERLALFFIVVLALGVITPAAPGFAEDDFVLRVNEKQTLIQIGQKYLENPDDWVEVARINGIQNADRIYPGQEIAIPFRLLKKKPLAGEVSFVGGVASRRTPDKDWKPLQPGDRLKEGDKIRTGPDGGVEFKYVDNTTIFLRAGTEVEIKQSRMESENTLVIVLFLKIGRIITQIKRATGTDTRYIIETPSAVAAARGTRYRVRGDPETTFTEVLDGSVRVEAMAAHVNLEKNEGSRVKKGAAPEPARKLLSPPRPVDARDRYDDFPVVIRFSKIDKAVSYRCVLARDREMKDVVLVNEIRPDAALEIPELPDGAYYLQSNSVDDIGLESAPSAAAPFRIRTNPEPPRILSPGGLFGTIKGAEALIKWRGAPDAAAHHLVIARDWHFEKIVYEDKHVEGDSVKIELPGGGTYFLKMSGIASDGHEGRFSAWKSVTVKFPSPPPAVE